MSIIFYQNITSNQTRAHPLRKSLRTTIFTPSYLLATLWLRLFSQKGLIPCTDSYSTLILSMIGARLLAEPGPYGVRKLRPPLPLRTGWCSSLRGFTPPTFQAPHAQPLQNPPVQIAPRKYKKGVKKGSRRGSVPSKHIPGVQSV